MKSTKLMLLTLVACLAIIGLGNRAWAFHSGGVAECEGCHSMHGAPPTGTKLLIKADQSSTCLSCHNQPDTAPSSYHISTDESKLTSTTPPVQRTPGGDFAWLKVSYAWSPRSGSNEVEPGETHGHNIIANDYNYVADSVNTTAPGGTYPSTNLSCISCHNPHADARRDSTGNIVGRSGGPIIASGSYDNSKIPAAGQTVGAYRFLGGVSYQPAGLGTTFPGSPMAVVPSTYNRTEAVTMTRTAYGSGSSGGFTTWSAWCGTCHTDMHTTGTNKHPTDQALGAIVATNYDQYIGSGNMGGSHGTAYSSLVPFAEKTTSWTTLKDHAKNNDSQLTGPSSTDEVMCLSCHRAHASGFEFGLRWNNTSNEFIAVNSLWPGSDSPDVDAKQAKYHAGRTVAQTTASYNDVPATKFSSWQRSLCNKCHAKD